MSFENTFFFFKREFQLMASAPDSSSLLSDKDTNKFFGVGGDWIPDILYK